MRPVSRTALVGLGLAALLALGACTERVQTAQPSARKSDAKAWETVQTPYLAPGWKPGDQASWDAQMRTRNQAQNEYTRVAAQPQ